ncbi:MAG: Phosphate acyltransferase [Alphaproteobacteria bacterium MarineAlpha5_Bin9]|nr:MAG: Phosphate acyltransferase [Alphaproteobacteria bacterium MarineAlpha5_Bin9]|tara:strand:- start:9621 stop:10634 length:1014 start_codon:yes stop_codon:yes gene_type:complete
MNNNNITIAIDAMGGENSPFKTLKGSEIFLNNKNNVYLYIFGDENIIRETISKNNIQLSNYSVINTDENINDEDPISIIIRSKKNSSIRKGLEFIKQKPFSGFVSSGNTGGIMTLSKLSLGMLEGIERPAICSMIPNKKSFSIILDLGANISPSAKNLFQFAFMGYCYHSIIKPNIEPKISLLNIGTEDNKGKEYIQECANLINSSFLKKYFIGYIEPDKIFSGESDIMITDGFTGNMILKTAEGLSNYIMKNLQNLFKKSILNKFAYKIIENDIKRLKDIINPEEYNGAMLLGVNGISIKSHGSANAYAFSQALENCYKFIKNDINSKIIHQLNKE